MVSGAGFGLAAGGGEDVALDGVGGGTPTTRLLGGGDAGESLEGVVVLALAGEDAGSLLDGAEFLGATDAVLAFEVQAIGGEGAHVAMWYGRSGDHEGWFNPAAVDLFEPPPRQHQHDANEEEEEEEEEVATTTTTAEWKNRDNDNDAYGGGGGDDGDDGPRRPCRAARRVRMGKGAS